MTSPYLEMYCKTKWINVCPQLLSLVIINRFEDRRPVGMDRPPAVAAIVPDLVAPGPDFIPVNAPLMLQPLLLLHILSLLIMLRMHLLLLL